MKIRLILIFILLITLFPIKNFIVYAQEVAEVEIKDNNQLKVSFEEDVQNPRTKEKTYYMVLKSTVDTDRLRITWQVTGVSAVTNEFQTSGNLKVEKDKAYKVPITVKPVREGLSEVYGKAEMFLPEGSVISTVRKNFISDKDLQILPLTSEYNSAFERMTLEDILGFVTILVGLFVFVFLATVALKKWLRRNPVQY